MTNLFRRGAGLRLMLAVAGWGLAGFAIAAPSTEAAGVPPPQPAPLPVTKNIGYTNTPLIPGTTWHVHDGTRPVPRVVTPGATFSHLAPPPADAVILFDGTDLSKWTGNDGEARWKVQDGFMEVAPKAGSIRTRDRFADFQLHIEFATPAKVEGNSQGRGNSGILFNGVYEVQVLDSFRNPTYPDGQCGALYGQIPPLVNASKPPGEWQSYDIIFESPRWGADRKLVKKANVTVIQNGVVLHHKREYTGTTPHQAVGTYDQPHPPEVFIELQDHNNPMRFRNIWLRRLGEYDQP
jgi:3-keto-disaccharide hydrolase